MRYLQSANAIIILLILYLISCEKENIVSSSPALVEGNWQGQLNGRSLFLTLIEGRFENSPTITGSAHLSTDSFSTSFLVIGGTHNGKDSVWFGLYKPEIHGKENFQFRARMAADSLNGIYKEFDDQSLMVNNGPWYTIRIP